MKYRPGRMVEAAYPRNTWGSINEFPPETTVADLLDPEMWCNVARQWLRPLDEIIVIPQGAPFRAHFIVLDRGDTYAKLKLLNVMMLNAEVEVPEEAPVTALLSESAPVAVEWKGPALKYSVIRKTDGERLKTGFAIKADAEEWAANHLLAMA